MKKNTTGATREERLAAAHKDPGAWLAPDPTHPALNIPKPTHLHPLIPKPPSISTLNLPISTPWSLNPPPSPPLNLPISTPWSLNPLSISTPKPTHLHPLIPKPPSNLDP